MSSHSPECRGASVKGQAVEDTLSFQYGLRILREDVTAFLGKRGLHESINMLHELERTIRREWAWKGKHA